MWNWKVLLGTAAGVVFLIWILLNHTTVKVNFLLFETPLPVWVIIIMSAIMGATISFAARVFMAAYKKKKAKEAAKDE